MNFTRLGYVVERAEVGEHREAIFAVTIPERPGAFLAFCEALGDRGVTEFNYRLASRAEAHIFVGLEVTGRDGGARHRARAEPRAAMRASISARTTSRRRTSGTWSAAGPRRCATRCVSRSSSPSGRARCGSSCRSSARGGTSRSSTTATTARRSAASSAASRCPTAERDALRARLDAIGFDWVDETDNPAGRFFLA